MSLFFNYLMYFPLIDFFFCFSLEDKVDHEIDDNSCPICLHDIVEHEDVTECSAGCRNEFHKTCIARCMLY